MIVCSKSVDQPILDMLPAYLKLCSLDFRNGRSTLRSGRRCIKVCDDRYFFIGYRTVECNVRQ